MDKDGFSSKSLLKTICRYSFIIFAFIVLDAFVDISSFIPFSVGNKMSANVFNPIEMRLKGRLTNPLLECEMADGFINKDITPFRPKVEDFINKSIDDGSISHASVYFRSLNNGVWFGVNEREIFTPASLLKLPLAMATMKAIEIDNSLLNLRIKFDKKFDLPPDINFQIIKPKKEIEIGQSYPVKELVESMLIYSDNQAALLLSSFVDNKIQDEVYRNVGVNLEEKQGEAYVSVLAYSRFLRILFNASYLSEANSEFILDLLTKSDFGEGIEKYLPEGVLVANKFGERGSKDNIQLHDCGVIYHEKAYPYLLCTMSRGKNIEGVENFLGKVSELIYNEINKQVVSLSN